MVCFAQRNLGGKVVRHQGEGGAKNVAKSVIGTLCISEGLIFYYLFITD